MPGDRRFGRGYPARLRRGRLVRRAHGSPPAGRVLESNHTPAQYVEATHLIVTDDNFQSANPDIPATQTATRAVLNTLLDQGIVPVVTGFTGATRSGVTTTLGRGGSDYTAALIGATLPADEVWIWTDVDGVMTADPRIVPNGYHDRGTDLPRSLRTGIRRCESAPSENISPGHRSRHRPARAEHVQPGLIPARASSLS